MSDTKLQADEQLKEMTKFARERADHPWRRNDAAKLAQAYRYIRIGGRGFRPISIDPWQPCGELKGFPGSVKSFSEALEKLKNLPVSDDPGTPGNNKGEHRLQAHLICTALTQPDLMPKLLACDDIFDELVFITDELNFDNKVRADLVFLGRKGETYFPVFIELKMQRELKRLVEQLGNAERIAQDFPKETTEFFSAAVAPDLELEGKQFDLGATRSVIIWPQARDPSRTSKNIGEWKDAGAGRHHVVEFCDAEKSTTGIGGAYTFSRV